MMQWTHLICELNFPPPINVTSAIQYKQEESEMGKRARERAEDGAHDLMSSEVAHVIRGTRYQVAHVIRGSWIQWRTAWYFLQVEIVPPLEPAYYPGRQVRRLWQGGQVSFPCRTWNFLVLIFCISGQQPLPLHPFRSTGLSTWVYSLKAGSFLLEQMGVQVKYAFD